MRDVLIRCCTAILFVCSLPLLAQAQFSRLQSKDSIRIAVLVYPNVELLDMSGPLDVFVRAGGLAPQPYRTYIVARERQPLPTDRGGLTILPDYTLADCPPPDIVIVPGCGNPAGLLDDSLFNAHEIAWLRHQGAQGANMLGVCTGGVLMAGAGLLDGKQSTTNAYYLDLLQQRAPATKVLRGVKYVDAGNMVTTSGITTGIDGALHVVGLASGPKVAGVVARLLHYNGERSIPTLRPSTTARHGTVITNDPVCKMDCGPRPAYTAAYRGKTYGLCSPICKEVFESVPERFVKTN